MIEMFDKLLDKLIAERTTHKKVDPDSKYACDMLMQDLKVQIAQAEQDCDEKFASHRSWPELRQQLTLCLQQKVMRLVSRRLLCDDVKCCNVSLMQNAM